MARDIFIRPNRQRNDVDTLQESIRRIQDSCDHIFKLKHDIEMPPETLVDGVFFGEHHIGTAHASPINMEVQCEKCNVVKLVPIYSLCPRCLEKMQKRGLYAGEQYTARALRTSIMLQLYICDGCGFSTIATK